MKDLAIAYRVYPGVSRVPAFEPHNKWELTRLCLQSFRRGLGGLTFKIWAILDACPPEYGELFQSVFTAEELEIVETAGIGNLRTFALQMDLLTRQREAELVFFAEDDYFYRPDALVEMVEFARSRGGDRHFLTPYDHPDSYATSSRHERHRVTAFGRRHWREASSTCLTFLAGRGTLLAAEAMLRSYSRGNMDCSLWLALTQRGALANPQVHAAGSMRLKIWVKTWLWGWRTILFQRRFVLWSPMPTLATHMESTGLAPVVDWDAEFVRASERR